ncbi:MAG TPA: alpha-E domain-containing protein, partial [Candidatus Kryptonia bacterium]|nr:alpha-E domain-containing protein [Candidatus Kryptonia bacterium]
TYPGFLGDAGAARIAAPERELLGVLLDERRVGSLRFNLESVVRTGRSVRDRLSSDALRVINVLHRELSRPVELNGAIEVLERVILNLAAFAGLCGESMSRGQGWRFLEIGRCLERAVQAITLLRSLIPVTSSDGPLWEAMLAIAHSIKTYRRRYRSQIQPHAVLDLLLLDESNPRSVGYQLAQLYASVRALAPEASRRSAAERLALDALDRVRLIDLDTINLAPGNETATGDLPELLVAVAEVLARLSDELTRRYFTQAELPQQLIRLA